MVVKRGKLLFFSAIGLLFSSLAGAAHAVPSPAFTAGDRYASIVVDGGSGRVLEAINADEALHPASLTKIMTLYMTFDALKHGNIKLKQVLPVSAHAASMTPTELGLKAGETITTEQAILGLVTKSANDAAVVLAEAVGGSEAEFGRLMTEQARNLGMNRTFFANASGLPNPNQVSSAHDMALLALAMLRDHRAEYRYFSTSQFTYRGHVYFNHNRLLALYKGVDGIKTGFIRDAGYNLVASAQRDGRRVIGVVFGGSSGHARDAHMITLLDAGFRDLDARGPRSADVDEVPTVRVAGEKQPFRVAATADFDFAPTPSAGPTAKTARPALSRATPKATVPVFTKAKAAAKRLVVFHRDPGHDNLVMDEIAKAAEQRRPGTLVAREGMTLRP